MKTKNIIKVAFIVIGLLIIIDPFFYNEEVILGRYVKVTNSYDVDIVQEYHTAHIIIAGDTVQVSVLSNFVATHDTNTDVVLRKKIGWLTGLVFGIRVSDKDTTEIIKSLKNIR